MISKYIDFELLFLDGLFPLSCRGVHCQKCLKCNILTHNFLTVQEKILPRAKHSSKNADNFYFKFCHFTKFSQIIYGAKYSILRRVVHGASCKLREISWGELSMGRLSMGQNVPGVSCPWGELSMKRVAYRAK
jgi:hypothetical protein